ncbi:Cytochrome c-552 [bacterium HR39]|nr:Cytochrome c-552 [bacterium HR39]
MRTAVLAALLLSAAALAASVAAAGEVRRVGEVQEDYARNCQGCHRADGLGAYGSVPRIRGFAGLFTHLPEGREYLIRVPGVVWAMLDDARLARLMNWMLEAYSRDELAPDFRPYTVEEIREARRRPLANVGTVRARLIAELQRRGLLPPGEDGLVSAKRVR